MRILVTGAAGFLGSRLCDRLASQGEQVFALTRREPVVFVRMHREPVMANEKAGSIVPVRGDILEPELGMAESLEVSAVYHLAADHRLGADPHGEIWNTNTFGTTHVIKWCEDHGLPHLYLCSTAYSEGNRNPYERSKKLSEDLARCYKGKLTIFKPSIIMGSGIQHFSQFVLAFIRFHRRAEIIRRHLEGTLRLPVIEPVFRLKANPEGRLNLIHVDDVARAMAEIKGEGTYWLTHPHPATLEEITRWVGEFCLVDLKAMPDFKMMPIEMAFHRLASAFVPYLEGEDFRECLWNYNQEAQPVNRESIHAELKRSLEKA